MFRLFDTLIFTIERIWQHRLLVMWVIIGLSVATVLSMSLTMYVDSVYTELLDSRLDTPPYAFRYRYLGAWNGNIGFDDFNSANGAVQDGFTDTIGLPVSRSVTYVRGGTWNVRMESGVTLGSFGLGTLSGTDDQMTIIAGEWSAESQTRDDGIVPLLLPEDMFYRMGVQVGDRLMIQRLGGQTVEAEVVALWRPTNSDDPAWIFPPTFFNNVILVGQSDFDMLLDGVENPIDETAWYLVFDGAEVRTSDVNVLLGNLIDGERDLQTVLPDIRRDLSPQDGLTAFNDEVNQLTQQLFIIIAPVGGLVLYFVSLVAGLLVNRQLPEDVKLRSRGMSRSGVLSIHVLMWLLLVGMALLVGIVVSPLVVDLVSRTSSFLRFDDLSSVINIVLTQQTVLIGIGTGLISASSGLYLAWRTTRQNVNSFRQLRGRGGHAWWQRTYLDMLILVPAFYVLYTLFGQGGLTTSADTPFSDPLAFVGPTLFALGLALVFLRVFPFLMNTWGRFVSLTTNIALLMALRELTRSIGRYRGALLMMSFTLSLTGFTASMASTLDQSLADSVDYQIGADMVLVTAIDAQTEQEQDTDTGQVTETVTGYNIPPTTELLEIDGIGYVSRVGTYQGLLNVGRTQIEGTIMGIDRTELAAVARFREDYADEPLANMLNKLAGQRTGILLSRETAEANNLVIGQQVTMSVRALNEWYEIRVPIVDFIDYFPTLDPNDGFFLITNLTPLYELVGTALPHDIWLSLAPDADADTVRTAIEETDFPVIRWLEPEEALQDARAEPARRGVLGFLSIGFVAAIMLTLIATIIQSTASFRAQSSQLGALRAMGLGGSTVGVYIILLQGMSAIGGILSGTSIGVLTTVLFLPLLDFSGGLPPYLVRVAWSEITIVYTVFAGVLFGVTLLTTLILSREQLATVVRLGDA